MDPNTDDHRTLEALVAHILDHHHAYVWREIERVPPLARIVARTHGAGHVELRRVEELVETLFIELRAHQLREEKVLFPHLVALSRADATGGPRPVAPFGRVASPVRVMELEHDAVSALLAELRETTCSYQLPAEACGSWRSLYEALEAIDRDLVRHIQLENEVLFPLGREVEARVIGAP